MSIEEKPSCRICFEPDNLIQPCNCSGSTAHVHKKCLIQWLKVSKRQDCEICHFKYIIIVQEPEKKYVFADNAIMDNFVRIYGIFMIPFSPIFFYIGLNAMYVYFAANLLWVVCFIIVANRVWMLRTAGYWKLCFALGTSVVSCQRGNYAMLAFDFGISVFFLLASCFCEKYRGTTI